MMIRPRSGDFTYSDNDFAIMQEDIALSAQSGANGVAFGLLTSNGEVDIERTRALVELSKPMQACVCAIGGRAGCAEADPRHV
jgi:copper homeostasis protein